jgi:hypothetical protein
MNKLISKLIGINNSEFNNEELLSNCDKIIKLSEFIYKNKPDLIFIPLTGALPIRILLTYVFEKNNWKLPLFRFIHLTSTSSSNIDLNVLKNIHNFNFKKINGKKINLNYEKKGSFKKVFLIDEVVSGSCWSLFFSPFANNLFKDFVKELNIKELNLVGISSNKKGLVNTRNTYFNNFIFKPFKLYYGFNCKIINILIDFYSEFDYKKYGRLYPLSNVELNYLIDNEKFEDVEKIVKFLLISLLELNEKFEEIFKKKLNIENHYDKNMINLVKKTLVELQKGLFPIKNYNWFESKKKNTLKIANNLITKIKKINPDLFKSNPSEFKLNINTFDVKGDIVFSDEPNLIGVERKYIRNFIKKNNKLNNNVIHGTNFFNHLLLDEIKKEYVYEKIKVRYDETKNILISKEFYFLMKFFINMILKKNKNLFFDVKLWENGLEYFRKLDVDFFNRMIFLKNKWKF